MSEPRMHVINFAETAGDALIDLATTMTDIANRLWTTAPKSGSAAELMLNGTPLSESRLTTFTQSYAAATDHFHAIARLVRVEEEFAASVASLARSFLETMGRGWWLLQSGSHVELEHRWAVLNVEELGVLFRKGVLIFEQSADGKRIGIAALLERSKKHLAAVKIRAADPQSYGMLATALLRAAGLEDPDSIYSRYSGISHGENASLLTLQQRKTGTVAKVSFSLSFAMEMFWILSESANAFVLGTTDAWGNAEESGTWLGARLRFHDVMSKLDSSVGDEPTWGATTP